RGRGGEDEAMGCVQGDLQVPVVTAYDVEAVAQHGPGQVAPLRRRHALDRATGPRLLRRSLHSPVAGPDRANGATPRVAPLGEVCAGFSGLAADPGDVR